MAEMLEVSGYLGTSAGFGTQPVTPGALVDRHCPFGSQHRFISSL